MFFFFFQAEDGIRDLTVTGVQTCALPILSRNRARIGEGRFLARLFHDRRLRRRSAVLAPAAVPPEDRKSTRLNSSHSQISYAVFCLKKKKINHAHRT